MPLIRIVDDDAGLRAALRFLLRGEGYAVEEYESAEAFLASDDGKTPGCVLLDVKMSGMSGLALQDWLRRTGIALPIIFLSAHGSIDMAVDAMTKGAVSFLPKPVSTDRLLQAIERSLHAVPAAVNGLPDEKPVFGEAPAASALTAREEQVVRLVAAGKSNREIAEALGIAKRTVEFFRAGAMRKLAASNAAELKERWLSMQSTSQTHQT